MEKKVKYAVVGTGSFGSHHINTLSLIRNVEIVAVCDVHRDTAEKVAEKYGIKGVYSDVDEMLAKEDIDIVTVATGDKAHKDATIKALNAGKNVLCEKPMSLHVEDCAEMIKAADKSGKILMVGQICRYTPGFIEAKRMVDEGYIGELFYVESEYAHDYAHIPGTDNWRVDPDRDPIIGGACHAIDLLRWIAGDPSEVSAFSNHKILTSWPVNDCTVAIFKFPNDVIGKVFTSIGCKRDYTMRTVLYGSRGTIVVTNTDNHLTLYRAQDGDEATDKFLGGVFPGADQCIRHEIPVEVNNHNIGGEQEAMIDSFLNGTPVLMTGKEGAKTVAVCCAAVESAKKGEIVKIDYNF